MLEMCSKQVVFVVTVLDSDPEHRVEVVNVIELGRLFT
jgi:hypothetical protein